ncbi:hypothetical protein [Pseudarthrobacter sp. NBSH8]|uniref:hypothetical protein n=1 Tax=Pseudarthrobacter sp. NBSH8 TaxID=2596911 RepID=UPI00351AEE75
MVSTAVAVTPMVLFLNGVVNPNSLEYATAAPLLANLALPSGTFLGAGSLPTLRANHRCLWMSVGQHEKPVAPVACLDDGRGLHSWDRDAGESLEPQPVGGC